MSKKREKMFLPIRCYLYIFKAFDIKRHRLLEKKYNSEDKNVGCHFVLPCPSCVLLQLIFCILMYFQIHMKFLRISNYYKKTQTVEFPKIA